MIQIHPSVLMSISEHYSRTQAVRPECSFVIGALLGKRSEQKFEIIDSFELKFARDADAMNRYTLDAQFYNKKVPLFKQVAPDLELIGWYTTSQDLNAPLHRQISEFIANPILLRLDPHKRESESRMRGSLPINVYEPVVHIDADVEQINFIEVGWTIVTEDVEIIGLEHNTNISQSAALDSLRVQHRAIKMLRDRIKILSKFVKDTQAGILPRYEKPLAEIARLCERLPLMDTPEYNEAYNVICNDVALNTYLGILTKFQICARPSSRKRTPENRKATL